MSILGLLPRYLAAFLLAALGLTAIQHLKGHSAHDSVTQGLLWGAISSTVYILAFHANRRRSAACPVDLEVPPTKE